jgi:hypothetical protein
MKRDDQRVERNESWRDEYLKWSSAFANAEGGTLGAEIPTEIRVSRGELVFKREYKRIMLTGCRHPVLVFVSVRVRFAQTKRA